MDRALSDPLSDATSTLMLSMLSEALLSRVLAVIDDTCTELLRLIEPLGASRLLKRGVFCASASVNSRTMLPFVDLRRSPLLWFCCSAERPVALLITMSPWCSIRKPLLLFSMCSPSGMMNGSTEVLICLLSLSAKIKFLSDFAAGVYSGLIASCSEIQGMATQAPLRVQNSWPSQMVFASIVGSFGRTFIGRRELSSPPNSAHDHMQT